MRSKGSRGAGNKAQVSEPKRVAKGLRRRWYWLAWPAAVGVALAVVIAASPASPFVAPMPGVFVIQQEGSTLPIRTRPARTEKTPAKSTQQLRMVAPTRTADEVASRPSQEPTPLVEASVPEGALEKPVKATRSKAPKVPRPRRVLPSLLGR
jgi:hypothetical protein